MSTSRSPGTPTASSSQPSAPGRRVFTSTFFSVSAAVNVRPRPAPFRKATSVSIVGVSGVWCTCAAGLSSTGCAGGAGVVTASTFAA